MAERKRFLLRIDSPLFDALERWAGDELRSVNAQIEYVLADAVRRAGRAPRRQIGTDDGTDASTDP
ncbi:MAG: toxin-antitoxin system HicB family antitoxin [Dehalococcoidia bacterium]